jgi:hypothetical protein
VPQYDVGYGRPPRNRQFTKGKSGNPKGRPKGSFNFSSLIERELNEKVTVNENGTRKRISKKAAIAKQLVNRAAGGDHKAIPVLLNEERSRDASPFVGNSNHLPADDQRVLTNLIARIAEASRSRAPVDRADPDDAVDSTVPAGPVNDVEPVLEDKS